MSDIGILGAASAFLGAAVAAGLPIALAATGGLFTAAAGSLSVALEASMLAGAFAAAAASIAGLPFLLAMAAGAGAGLLSGLLLAFASERLRAEVFVAGLAVNLLVPGLESVLSSKLYATKGVVTAPGLAQRGLELPLLGDLPLAGRALFGQDPASYLLAAAIFALAFLWHATPLGPRLRAAGEPGESLEAAGLSRSAYRVIAHLVAGAAAGLAGAALAARVAAFVPGMSAGRGWIALVAVYLGGRKPLGTALAGLGFGLLVALANAGQAFAGAPAELLLALPYLLAALALVFGRALRRR